METPAPSIKSGQIAQVSFGVATDPGKVRPLNEDNYALPFGVSETQIEAKGLLLLVADGVGGHQAGEVASALAARTAMDHYYATSGDDVAENLRMAVLAARMAIQRGQAESSEQADMGSTLVMAVIQGNQLTVANVGDSRCYRLRGSKIVQLSQDHSWVAEQVRAGVLTEDEARNHVYRSILNRALGRANISGEPDIQAFDWQPADRLLLCSDGLWDALRDPHIATLLTISSGDVESVARGLVRMAKDADGSDNITAVVACGPDAKLGVAIPPVLSSRLRSGLWWGLPVLLIGLAVLFGAGALAYSRGWLRGWVPSAAAPGVPLATPVVVAASATVTPVAPATPSSPTAPPATVTLNSAAMTATVPTATGRPAVLTTATLAPTTQPALTDFMLCGEADFDQRRDRCTAGQTVFPADTEALYAYWAKPSVPNNAEIKVIWLQDDSVIHAQFCVVKRRLCEGDDIAPMWAHLTSRTTVSGAADTAVITATPTATATGSRRKTPTPRRLVSTPVEIAQPVLGVGRYHVQVFVNDELQYDAPFSIGPEAVSQ